MQQRRRTFLRHFMAMMAGMGITLARPLEAPAQKAVAGNRGNRTGDGRMRLTFRPFDLRLRHVFTISGSSRTATPVVLTEIHCDGYTGYGEASMPPYLGESQASVVEFLKKVNLEQFKSPFEMEDILTYVDGIAENNTAAKAAVDIALHDLVGKIIGQPWHRIWGLDGSRAPSTTFTIGIDTPEAVKSKTQEAAPLYNILKVKLGRDTDRAMIEAIRSVTGKPLAVDANQGWNDRRQALDMICWLREQGVVMVEQPMSKHRLDDIAWITERSPLPIFADESFQRLDDVLKLKGAFNGVNIKLMKCTGMREAWKILNVARAAGMKVMIGCMTETSCAISAAAQLSPAVDFADLDGNLLITNDIYRGVTVENGVLVLNNQPGIGIYKPDR